MFTLKFIQTNEDSKRTVLVSCDRFDVFERSKNNVDINVDGKNGETGTCYRVSELDIDFDHCFIENLSGKTIAHYSCFS